MGKREKVKIEQKDEKKDGNLRRRKAIKWSMGRKWRNNGGEEVKENQS